MSSVSRERLIAGASKKVAAANSLLEAGHYSDAYYLAGYALEFILKARIAKLFAADTLPDPKLVRAIYTHDLEQLVALARLKADWDDARSSDRDLALDWVVATAWNAEARYRTFNEIEARRLVGAIGSEKEGLLGWFRSRL